MNCDFDYCIYNRELSCLLKEIRINPLGMCDDCIIASVPDGYLETLKQTQLAALDSRHAPDSE